MCGIAGIFGHGWDRRQLEAMAVAQTHRGPDDFGVEVLAGDTVGLAHNRLSIIDLSPAGHQPMFSHDGELCVVFNGEIYNYLELRNALHEYPFRSRTDTEVILAAYDRWGPACLERFLGMFAFLLWDNRRQTLFAARDRFGVKPLYYHRRPDGTLLAASEVKALHAAGAPVEPDPVAWSTYLSSGLYDHSERTFWEGVQSLPPGHYLTWRQSQTTITCWYDAAEAAGLGEDTRPAHVVEQEYESLARESLRLRFRSDVPVGINLSGGLDSSMLLGLVQSEFGQESDVKVFTFVTGDERYDELPWVRQMLNRTHHPLTPCELLAHEVPDLAASVQYHQDEPFGGLPTLAYARLFECARAQGVKVLLDGQGMDEQWAGYDYYRSVLNGSVAGTIQGAKDPSVRPDCLTREFRGLSDPWKAPRRFLDPLRDLQYRDLRHTKIPRGLRFNDRVSMRVSTELREPFLDHRLVELALRQPLERKISNGTSKFLLRRIAGKLLPGGIVEAPKRPLQTPQREWLRGPLREWANDQIQTAIARMGGSWLCPKGVSRAWHAYLQGESDNSFYVWQWASIGLSARSAAVPA
jgi:asparagine synthase (glutamine-hydrolysing)